MHQRQRRAPVEDRHRGGYLRDTPVRRGLRLVAYPSLGGVDGDRLGRHLHPLRSGRSFSATQPGFDWLIIAVNVGIVLYMLMLRLEAVKKRHAAQHPAPL